MEGTLYHGTVPMPAMPVPVPEVQGSLVEPCTFRNGTQQFLI